MRNIRHSKATKGFVNEYNYEIDQIINQLQELKINANDLNVLSMHKRRVGLDIVNSSSNRQHISKAFDKLYESMVLDLEDFEE